MTPPPPKSWFRARRYGWGWGLPITWQGWVVLLSFILLSAAGAVFLLPAFGHVLFYVYLAGLVAALVAVCWLKGGSPRWHWGPADSPPR